MFERLRSLLMGEGRAEATAASGCEDLHRAAAALLCISARLDGSAEEAEHVAIRSAVERYFGVKPEESAQLLAEADMLAQQSTDLFALTNEINRHLELERRITIIEMLWEVVYADGRADDFEANLTRRAAGLLYVSDQDSGAARKRVLQRLGLDPAS